MSRVPHTVSICIVLISWGCDWYGYTNEYILDAVDTPLVYHQDSLFPCQYLGWLTPPELSSFGVDYRYPHHRLSGGIYVTPSPLGRDVFPDTMYCLPLSWCYFEACITQQSSVSLSGIIPTALFLLCLFLFLLWVLPLHKMPLTHLLPTRPEFRCHPAFYTPSPIPLESWFIVALWAS